MGNQAARSGKAYTGIISYNFFALYNLDQREYIRARLSRPMVKDSAYCVRFFVSLAESNTTSNKQLAVNKLGASFSDTPVHSTYPVYALDLPFHILNDTSAYLSDTGSWQEIQGIYIAKGGEQWITIGTFGMQTPRYIHLAGPSNGTPNSYYFIDDVTVLPVVTAFDSSQRFTLCDSVLTLTASMPKGPYQWNTGATTRSIQIYSPGHYSCNGYKDCNAFTDHFDISATPQHDSVHDSLVICSTEPSVLELRSSQPTGPYKWNTGASTATLLVSQPGSYNCTAKSDCRIFRDIFYVVQDSAAAPAARDTAICQFTPAPMLGSDSGLIWFSDPAAAGSTTQPTINTTQAGKITLYFARRQRSCISKKVPFTINIKGLPVKHSSETILACNDGTQRQVIIGNGPETGVSYSWNTGDELCCIRPQRDGRYIRKATNECGTAIDTTYIASRECDSCIYFPNAFSPNGDGVNDGFRAMKLCPIKEFHMEIFNRWGEPVYQSDRIEDRWNGAHKGVRSPAGTYMYYAAFTTELSEKKYIVKGSVMLLR